jgi:hypothetical protein
MATAGLALALATAAPPVLVTVFAAQSPAPRTTTRPATTTVTGDTGLWFVPTASILPARSWGMSAYRVSFDYEQGFTNVANWTLTFGVGALDRAELFGALTAVNRIDRDVRPLFFPTHEDSRAAGVVNEYPFVRTGWTGNHVGDLWLGAKLIVFSHHGDAPAAVAVRAMVKVPTASRDHGAGTGKVDVAADSILSVEINERAELSAFGGFILRRDPPQYDLLSGIRWGLGAALPTRRHLRLAAELHGETYMGDYVAGRGPALQSLDPFTAAAYRQKSPVNATIAMTWLGTSGLFAGAGVNWNSRIEGRSHFGSFRDEPGDALGFQIRVGYHTGARMRAAFVPPRAPAATRAPPHEVK